MNYAVRRVKTHRSGVFEFQVGVDLSDIQPLLQRVEDAHERFIAVPVLPSVVAQFEREVVVSSVFGTNTIEGAMLTEEETAAIIDNGQAKEEKEKRVLNIKNAYSKLEEFAADAGSVINIQEGMLTELHAIITDGLLHPENVPGEYRNNRKGQLTKVGDVTHGGVYGPPKCRDDVEMLIKVYLEWINSPEVSHLSPLVRAPLAHYYFERIHPFWDGNGRVGRALEVLILKCAGYKYAPFALSRHYCEHIDEYFSVFNLSRKAEERNESSPNAAFINFFLEGMLKVLNQLHNRINKIISILLYETLLNTKLQRKEINARQFAIVNNLILHNTDYSLSELQAEIWYATPYKKLTKKTQTRDLKGLEEQKLIYISRDKKVKLLLP